MVNQQTQRSEAQSLSAETAASSLSHPTLSRTGKGAAQLGNNSDGMPIQHYSLKVDEIILRPASAEVLFLVATIRTTGDTLQLSCLEPAELLESTLGHTWKVDGLTLKPFAPAGSWQVFGCLHRRNADGDGSRPAAQREATLACSGWDLRKRARALRSSLVVAPDIDKDAGVDDDGVLNVHSRRDRRGNGNGSGIGDGGSDNGDYGYDDEDYEPPARMNRRWDPLDEKHLLAWRKENKPWQWIFDQFPDRTEGAVRLR